MFRVLVAGPRHFLDFAALRATLVHRLPGVSILTAGGPGTAFLAAAYAPTRGLDVTTYPLNVSRFPHAHNAQADREARLVEDADAAVVVWDRHNRDLRELLSRLRRKGVPVWVLDIGRRKVRSPVAEPERLPRMLPD